MDAFNELKSLLSYHHQQKREQKWHVNNSKLSGRGLFASEDLEPGEIIFTDHPILIGPRSGAKILVHCVICADTKNLKVCPKGCGLPICSIYCRLSIQHLKECQLIRSLLKGEAFTDICIDVFRALMPLRSLLLEDKLVKLIFELVKHDGPKHGYEIELVKKHLNLTESQETHLKNVCSVLDSNVFETIKYFDDNKKTSLRALYVLSALMNHSCVPNTMNYFDNNQNMIVKATRSIPKGSEIFTSYTSLLWGTTSRRHHLDSTKHFWCVCDRCKDPREFGANLSALRCISKDCSGALFPEDPLDFKSRWNCDNCEMVLPSRKIGIIQSSLGGLLKSVDITDLGKLIDFLKNRLVIVVPFQNQIAVEIKLKIVWMLGNTEGYFWKDLSDEYLDFKKQLCLELSNLCKILQIDKSIIHGQILYELYRCLKEQISRITVKNIAQTNKISELEIQSKDIFSKTLEILKDDILAPNEIKKYLSKDANCNNIQ